MNDDDLILYYYRDRVDGADDGLSDADARRIGNALQADPDLARRYAALCADMDQLGDTAPAPAPPDAVARWHDAIDRAAAAETPANRFRAPVWLAAMTAVLVLGIGIGLNVDRGDTTGDTTADTGPAPTETAPQDVAPAPGQATRVVPAAFTRGLTTHMRDSRRLLTELPQAEDARRAELVERIVGENLVFERAAEANGSHDLARVLRSFRLSLGQLATPRDANGDIAAGADQLSFEMNAVLTRLSRPTSMTATSF